ncbi:MAG: SUMF1/EgtB/PvdO family nonheme iron enzyme [Cyanobacteria bacterium J06642_3]
MSKKLLSYHVLSKILLAVCFLPILGGCQVSRSDDSGNIQARQDCEADPDFAWITRGEAIVGSDRQERDFAYRISAEGVTTQKPRVNQVEQQLRQRGWFDREQPKKSQFIAGFCLGRNLVTNQKYREFIQATNHPEPFISESDYQIQGFLVHPYQTVTAFLWKNGSYPSGTDQHPVVLVSYDDALAFAKWKGEQTGKKYRLPTAPEWEKAARGTDGRYFPWGNDWRKDATNTGSSGLDYTSAIAKFPLSRSVFGVEDMAGNVFEYTSTLVNQGRLAVMKGCSWDDLPGFCRAAYRHTRPIGSRHILFGFRLVQE